MSTWQLREAKARLSEVVRAVEREGPQEITVPGRAVAVVLSKSDYERLTGAAGSLVDLMRRSPLFGLDELALERDRGPAREIEP